jgi:hypothetical protein
MKGTIKDRMNDFLNAQIHLEELISMLNNKKDVSELLLRDLNSLNEKYINEFYQVYRNSLNKAKGTKNENAVVARNRSVDRRSSS